MQNKQKTHPNLIGSTRLRQVSHPFYTVVVVLLEHLQEPDNQTRSSEHQDLEVDIYWWSRPYLSMRCAGQVSCGTKSDLLTALYSWYSDQMQVRK